MGVPKLQAEFKVERQDLGRADTLRYNVLSFVVEENYEKAVQELRKFLDKDTEYPKFKERIERYIMHSIDLVNAIRAKRKFPGINSLTMAKQQELNEKFRVHFNELQYVLKKIEKIQVDLRLEDVRSTVWVVRAIMNAAIVIAISAFLLDVSRGLLKTAWVVIDDIFVNLTAWLFQMIGM